MKKVLGLTLFLLSILTGCSTPSTPNPATADTLTLSGASTFTGAGAFYNYSQSTTVFFNFASLPYSGTFNDIAHDTLGFTVTFSGPISFTYQLNTSTSSGDANPSYISPRMKF